MAGQENSKLIAVNRKARHDYFVMEAMEAGVELVGTEVKSIRTGAVNLKDSWVEIDGGELYVLGMHISPYEKGNIFNRTRCVNASCWCINGRSNTCRSSRSCKDIH